MQKIKYKIGVMGSVGRGIKLPDELLQKAKDIGKEIAKNQCILVTGGCMGTPHAAAIGADEEGGITLGFSPAATLKEHLKSPISYPLPPKNCILVFTGFGKEGRNVLAIRTCDAVIFISGRIGTLNEFSLAYQLGKVIGVLKGSGGIADRFSEIVNWCNKDTGAILISDTDSKNLVRKVINVLEKRK